MITYKLFYKTLNRLQITEYQLIEYHGISAHTIHRMSRGENMTLRTVNQLCNILQCDLEDIIEYEPD